MGVILAIGQHNKITAKEKVKICDCWFPEWRKPVKRGECKWKGCFLDREEKWRLMTDEEQKADDERRRRYAKEVVGAITEFLETCEKIKALIKR